MLQHKCFFLFFWQSFEINYRVIKLKTHKIYLILIPVVITNYRKQGLNINTGDQSYFKQYIINIFFTLEDREFSRIIRLNKFT